MSSQPPLKIFCRLVHVFCAPMILLVSCDRAKKTQHEVRAEEKLLPLQSSRRTKNVQPPAGDLVGLSAEFSSQSHEEQHNGFEELLKLFQSADMARICALLDSIDIKDGKNERAVFAAMFALSQKNPAAYLRYACSLNKDSQLLQLNSALRNLIATDTNAVLKWLQDETRESESADVIAASLRRNLLEVRPELGVPLAQTCGSDNKSDVLNGYRAWGLKDPVAALATARGTLQGGELAAAVGAILEGASSKDPSEAMRLIDQIGSDLKESSRMTVLAAWFEKDPATVASALAGLSKVSVLTFLAAQPGRMREIMARQPETAFKILEGMELSHETRAIYQAASDALATKNPLDALNWLKRFPDSPQRNEILESAYRNWVIADPGNAERAIVSISDSSRDNALRGLASALVQLDPKSASLVVPRLPSADRAPYFASILDAMATHAPAARAAIVETAVSYPQILQSPEILNGVEKIALDYAKQSPDDGKNWILSLDETYRPAAVRGFVTTWLKSDLPGATAWLQSLDAGQAKDAGIRALIAEIQTTDPDSARQWEASLSEFQVEQP